MCTQTHTKYAWVATVGGVTVYSTHDTNFTLLFQLTVILESILDPHVSLVFLPAVLSLTDAYSYTHTHTHTYMGDFCLLVFLKIFVLRDLRLVFPATIAVVPKTKPHH